MKRIIAYFCCVAVLFSLFGCAKESRYNEAPDLSKKVVGSDNLMTTKVPLKSVSDMAKLSDVIVTGTVVSDSEVIQFNSSGNEEYAAAAAQKGINVYLPATIATVKITKIIDGSPADETIQVFQLGEPHKADMQTKLENGDSVLLILSEFDNGYYQAVDLENSIFYVDDNNRLTSMGNEMMCARYDNRPVSLLLEDLAAADCVSESIIAEWK